MSTIDEALIIAEARSWLGTPYRHQASVKHVGCDCLGLVRGVYEALVGTVSNAPHAYSPHWAETGQGEILLAACASHLMQREGEGFAPGDVLVFRWALAFPAKHMAIVSESNRMIHAYDGAAVVETTIGPWWRRRIAGVFAFPNSSNFRYGSAL